MLSLRGMRSLKSLDILTSGLNEAQNIPILYSRIQRALTAYPNLSWNLHIVDNASTDDTWKIIRDLSTTDKRVKGYRMSRTFGLDAALTCVLDQANADAIVIMCSDLQDPPEVIPNLIDAYLSGYEHVVVRVSNRSGVSFSIRFLTKIFYRLAAKLSNGVLPPNVSDFRLASRSCYLAARKIREQHRFIRGQFAWVGFETAYVEINRPPRQRGVSKFAKIPKLSAIFWALRSIFSHSLYPLFAIGVLGGVGSILSFILLVVMAVVWITLGVPFAGFGTVIGVITLGFSLTFLILGILSLYIASIYEEVKNRPLYLVAETTHGKILT